MEFDDIKDFLRVGGGISLGITGLGLESDGKLVLYSKAGQSLGLEFSEGAGF